MTNLEGLIALLNQRRFEWAVQAFSPTEEAGAYYAGKLAALREFMASRNLEGSAPSLSSLLGLVESNPFKLDAFLEALVSLENPEIMAAAWRMLQGLQLDSLEVRFERARSFSMSVSLKSPCGETETYTSDDIDDMNFIRHLMKSKSGGRPIINGFFALRRPELDTT